MSEPDNLSLQQQIFKLSDKCERLEREKAELVGDIKHLKSYVDNQHQFDTANHLHGSAVVTARISQELQTLIKKAGE